MPPEAVEVLTDSLTLKLKYTMRFKLMLKLLEISWREKEMKVITLIKLINKKKEKETVRL
jgi:hypothetical protein